MSWNEVLEWKEKSEENKKLYDEWEKAYYAYYDNVAYYRPYDAEKCKKIGGHKSRYSPVRQRYARIREIKNYTLPYPDPPADYRLVPTGDMNPVKSN